MNIDEVMEFVERVSHYDPTRPQDLSRLRAATAQHVAEAVAREREECAKACEDVATTQWDGYAASYNSAVFDCAAAIRARAEKEGPT